MTTFTEDFAIGLAVDIDAGGIVTYPADSSPSLYVAGEPQADGALVVMTPYPIDDDPSLSNSTIGVQFRTRSADGNPAGAMRLADQLFDRYHGIEWLELSTGIRIVYGQRISSIPLDKDANGRWEQSDNYQFRVHRPSTHRQ